MGEWCRIFVDPLIRFHTVEARSNNVHQTGNLTPEQIDEESMSKPECARHSEDNEEDIVFTLGFRQ